MPRNCYGLCDKNRGPEIQSPPRRFSNEKLCRNSHLPSARLFFWHCWRNECTNIYETVQMTTTNHFKDSFRFELNPFAAAICYKILTTLLEFYRFIIRPEFFHMNEINEIDWKKKKKNTNSSSSPNLTLFRKIDERFFSNIKIQNFCFTHFLLYFITTSIGEKPENLRKNSMERGGFESWWIRALKSERYNFAKTVCANLLSIPLIEAFSFLRKLPPRIVPLCPPPPLHGSAPRRRFTRSWPAIKRQPRNLNRNAV